MGEFKRRIKQDWVSCLEEDYMPILERMTEHDAELNGYIRCEYIFQIIEEARLDFLTAANTDNTLTIGRNEIAIWEWFKKWFGDGGDD